MNATLNLGGDAIMSLANWASSVGKMARQGLALPVNLNLHVKPADLMCGYAFGSEFDHGWWGRSRRVFPPTAEDTPWRSVAGARWSVRRQEVWLCEVSPVASEVVRERFVVEEPATAYWFGSKPIGIPQVRIHFLGRVSSILVRKRLELETGYERLETPEDCLDAARVYPPKSVASRFCVAAAEYCSARKAA